MRILETDRSPLDIFCEASSILSKAVGHTLGPNGTNSAIQNKDGHYEIINDGKSIIEPITSLDPAVAPALETLKQASFETNRKAGDGTTSTTIIMDALLQGSKEYLHDNRNVSNTSLRNTLDNCKNALLEELDKTRIEIKPEDYSKVAEVALGGPKYADLVADVFNFLGKGRRPALLKSDIPNIEIEKIDGINLTKIKIVSNLFINTTEHRDLDIIILFEPINRFQELTQLLRRVQQTGKETILFYNQLSTDILENILFNYTNGAIKLIPICLGGYGQGTYSIMEELADYTEANIIDNTNCKISDISKIIFGHVDYGILNSEQIVLKNDKKIQKNYLHLDDKSCIMRVGGTNIVEREEVYRRIEDAINSLGNAIEYGIVLGAGQTYHDITEAVLSKNEIPVPTFIVAAMNIIKSKLQDDETDLSNIYDSAMVVKEVITNAFSIVSQVITTHVLIHENIR